MPRVVGLLALVFFVIREYVCSQFSGLHWHWMQKHPTNIMVQNRGEHDDDPQRIRLEMAT